MTDAVAEDNFENKFEAAMKGETPPLHKHALVIGKFYPFHKGHQFLMETAMDNAEHTTVFVYGSRGQHIDVADRVKWIKTSLYPKVKRDKKSLSVIPVINDMYEDYVDQNVWEAHDQILKSALRVHGWRFPVDLIVSSEPYGQEMAEKYFGGIDFLVADAARTKYPISGTDARNNLFGKWQYLPESTRAGLIPRIIVTGAESTGTTTLSLALAEHYKGRYVPEYGRQYTEEWLAARQDADPEYKVEDLEWRHEDFVRIAERQTMLENNAARKQDDYPVVIADTDAFSTMLWEARYLHNPGEDRLPWEGFKRADYASKNLPRRDIYIITDHFGVEFEQDGIRDGEHIRADMTEWFEDSLTDAGHPWVILRGSHEERMAIAIRLIDKIIEERLSFH